MGTDRCREEKEKGRKNIVMKKGNGKKKIRLKEGRKGGIRRKVGEEGKGSIYRRYEYKKKKSKGGKEN